tara:strand:- start:648 stop:1007 length:360 start_codon:yes stop_codon:yes gene_type:complete
MKYQKSHEWVKIEDDIATIGISDHAQEELTELCFIELPSVGDTFEQGQTFGIVESVKSASDVFIPISGEIVEVNETILDDPAIVNSDAEGEGWFLKIKISKPEEYDDLLTKEDYISLVS